MPKQSKNPTSAILGQPITPLTRRQALGAVTVGIGAIGASRLGWTAQALAATPGLHSLDIRVAEQPVYITGKPSTAVLMNGTLPGPVIRAVEGEELEVRVLNSLKEDTSIHWHGLLVPPDMDGVPGLSFPGIRSGETFIYRFRLRHSGTYWFHSHSGGQELQGHFGALIVAPTAGERARADRDYVVMLSDWSDEPPLEILANLKKVSGYYNYNKRTVPDFLRALSGAPDSETRRQTLREWQAWSSMRMDPTDLADVSGYTFLVNGKTPAENWTAEFRPGERVRLRFINAAGMTFFDVKIPELRMSVVQADGQDVEPVAVDEFRIAPGETYDVMVEPAAGRAYTIFAQSLDRSGYARGTLAEHIGAEAPIPALDPRPVRSLSDMGGAHASHSARTPTSVVTPDPHGGPGVADGHEMSGSQSDAHVGQAAHDVPAPADHSAHTGHGGMVAPAPWRKLRYADLRSATANHDTRPPSQEIVLRLTGDMERYIWTINGKKLSQSKPFPIRFGERVRITYVNETMMEHPMHLHGMFVELQTGQGAYAPRKHTVIVGPGETVSTDFTADERGSWALHCHLLLHMVAGMFVVFTVGDQVADRGQE